MSPAIESPASILPDGAPAHPPSPRRSPSRARLWIVLLITALSSIGTGIVTSGLYFLSDFDRAANYTLGVLLGVVYIVGAVAIGPVVALAVRRFAWLSTRAALMGVLTALAACCAAPWIASGVGPVDLFLRGASAGVPPWSMWFLAATYGALSGALWPVVESFLSGGRRATELRHATGLFNLTWSAAVLAGYWIMQAYVELRPVAVIVIVGVTHLLCVALALALPREPGRHEAHATHEPHPPVYAALLEVCRRLLPLSYLISCALIPFLPTAFERMGIGEAAGVRVTSLWVAARVVVFLALMAWHGWHGRWWLPLGGLAALVAGFGLAVFGPVVHGGGGPGLPLMAAGLTLFGIGMASIYTCALYYAMEVGDAAVEAGGTHEALIGVGYTAGPLIGLLITLGVGTDDGWTLHAWLLGTVAALSVGVAWNAVVRALRSVRPENLAERAA